MAQQLTFKKYKEKVDEQAQQLLDVLAYAAQGELDIDVPIPEGIDVLTDLAIGFNFLLDDLRALVTEQKKSQELLEKRVAERTQELESALAEVQAIQRRYIEGEWTDYATDTIIGNEMLPTNWLPVLETAVVQQEAIAHTNGESTLALPVQYANEIIGIMGFGGDIEETAWDANDLTAVEAIVEQVGLALENQRLFDQTQAALLESSTLYEASAKLNAAETYDDILSVVRKYTIAGQNAQSVSFSLFDRPWTATQKPELIEVLNYYTARENAAIPTRFLLEEFPSADYLLKPDKTIIIEDLNDPNPEIDENTHHLYTKVFGVTTAIFAPLVAGGQWIGFINVLFENRTTFTESNIRRLAAIAGQSAVAIQNLGLLEETARKAQREQMLREITAQVRSSANIDTIMKTAVQEIGRALGRKTFITLEKDNKTNINNNSPIAEENGA